MIEIGLVVGRIDQFIRALIGAERMEIDPVVLVERLEGLPLPRCRKAAVVEPAAVLRPVEPGELHPLDRVVQHLTRGDVQHLDRPPVATAILDQVGELSTILGNRIARQRGRIVFRPLIRIDQDPRLSVETVADVENALVLQAVVARIEIPAALFGGQAEAFVIGQLRNPRLERVASRQLGQEGIRHRILAGDPRGHFLIGADVVFKPAVRIGDFLAEGRFDDVAGPGFGVVWGGQILSLCGCGDGGGDQRGGGTCQKGVAEHGRRPLVLSNVRGNASLLSSPRAARCNWRPPLPPRPAQKGAARLARRRPIDRYRGGVSYPAGSSRR